MASWEQHPEAEPRGKVWVCVQGPPWCARPAIGTGWSWGWIVTWEYTGGDYLCVSLAYRIKRRNKPFFFLFFFFKFPRVYALARERQRGREREEAPESGCGHATIPSPSLHPVWIWGMCAHAPGVFFKLLAPRFKPWLAMWVLVPITSQLQG